MTPRRAMDKLVHADYFTRESSPSFSVGPVGMVQCSLEIWVVQKPLIKQLSPRPHTHCSKTIQNLCLGYRSNMMFAIVDYVFVKRWNLPASHV